MAEVNVKINDAALAKLLVSPEVVADLERRGKAVAAAANADSSWGGYYSEASGTGKRAHARVWNVKHGAADDEARNNRLLRSLDAGRG